MNKITGGIHVGKYNAFALKCAALGDESPQESLTHHIEKTLNTHVCALFTCRVTKYKVLSD